MSITLDGVNYNVNVVYPSMTRSFSIPQGSGQGKSLSYSDIDDIFGTEYGYTMHVEPVIGQESEYDSFYEAISAPVGSHTVVMPYGQTTISFECKVSGGSDVFYGRHTNNRFGGLQIAFTPVRPQRTV